MSTSYEDRVKGLSRIRSKRYYEKNKAIIAERRKARRLEVLEIVKRNNEEPREAAPTGIKRVIKKPRIKIVEGQPLTLVLCNQFFDNQMTYSSSDKILQPTTINKYKKNIKQFFNLTGENNLRSYLENPERIYNLIDKAKFAIASKVDIIVSILKLLNNNIIPNYPKAKYDLIDGYFRKFKGESDTNRKSKITDEKLAVDSLQTLEKLIRDKYGVNSKEHIIIGLYKEVPKRDDFYLKIVETKPKTLNDNYIVIPKKGNISVIINIHKTGEKYQAETENLSASLSSEIRAYLLAQKLKPNDYLFTNKKLGPFIKTMFAKVGKPEINGPTALRHSIITTTLNKPGLTVAESRKLAETMKHSPAVQGLYNRVLKK
jgi:hypothetical protein